MSAHLLTEHDADSGADEAEREARSGSGKTPREMLVAALWAKGLLGTDEDEFVDVLSDLGVEEDEGFAETHDWTAEMERARAEGLIDDLGCGWVRLSRKWWIDRLERFYALPDARAIVDLLAGDGEFEAEPGAKGAAS